MRTKITLLICLITFGITTRAQRDTLVEIKDISIDSMGDLKWKITFRNEVSQQVEQFKNGRWEVVADRSWASFPLADPVNAPSRQLIKDSIRVKYHAGLNRYRIVVSSPAKIVSPEVHLRSSVANDTLAVWVVHNEIVMDRQEYYEVLDHRGSTVLRGEGRKVDIPPLPRGSYFLYTKRYTRAFVK